jgi:hypothetical protein
VGCTLGAGDIEGRGAGGVGCLESVGEGERSCGPPASLPWPLPRGVL